MSRRALNNLLIILVVSFTAILYFWGENTFKLDKLSAGQLYQDHP